MTPFENDIAIATELPWHTNTSESTKVLKEALEAIRTKAAFNSVAMLDTKMLYVVASKTGLNELADEFRNVILDGLKFMQKPPIAQLKYEDIILNNPKEAMRTFTNGETSISEAAFYRANQILEDQLGAIIDSLRLADQSKDINFS